MKIQAANTCKLYQIHVELGLSFLRGVRMERGESITFLLKELSVPRNIVYQPVWLDKNIGIIISRSRSSLIVFKSHSYQVTCL